MLPSNSKRARQVTLQDNSLDIWTWVSLAAIAAIVLFSAVNAFLNVGSVTNDYMDEAYLFRLAGEPAQTYAQTYLEMTVPSQAANFEYEYGTDQGWPFHIRFNMPATSGTSWVDEILCPASRFPNAEITIEEQSQQLNLICDQNPNVQMTIDQSDTATWTVTLEGSTS